jgi:hypothetical protein
MELDATGIEGRNQKLLELQTKFEALMKSAKDGLEVDASAIAATVQADALAAVGELRTLTPKLPELPSVNLQAQLSGLSGLAAGLPQHTQALADIATKFGSALTAGGFNLNTLVSDAASAVTGGKSLSGIIPNFETPAAGGDVIQKAIEVLQANPIKPEDLADLAEKVSDLVESPNFIALKAELKETADKVAEQMKTIDVSGLQLPTDTVITLEKLIDDTENPIRKLPTIDDKFYSPADPNKAFTEVAFFFTLDEGPATIETERRSPGALGGRVEQSSSEVTKTKITTPEDAATTEKTVEKQVSGGTWKPVGVPVTKKANISPHGFSHRPVEAHELFSAADVETATGALAEVSAYIHKIVLKNKPIKILDVRGYIPSRKSAPHRSRRIRPESGPNNAGYQEGRWDLYKFERSKEMVITGSQIYGPAEDRLKTVDVDGADITKPHPYKGTVFRVRYQYADSYDPAVSKPPK